MNILIVQESNWISRNPHQQHHLMERLAARGHTIRVIDYDIDWKKDENKHLSSPRKVFPNIHKIFPDVAIQVIRPRSVRLPVIEYPALIITHWQEIVRQIEEYKPDVIIGFGILNAWIAARHALKHKIPFVYYWIDALDTLIPEKFFQKLGRLLEKQTLRKSSKVIAINKRLLEYTIKFGADPKKTELIGAGIDLKKFNPTTDGSEIRLKYGIEKNDTVLFFMGWLYHFSGLKELSLELSRSQKIFPHIKLLIVGDGDAYDDLQKIREEHNLPKVLILTGKQPYERIPEFIAACDICILPADPNEIIMQDIVPIKIYEYMAMGKPVICTKLPGIMKEFGENHGILYAESPKIVLDIAHELFINGSIKDFGYYSRIYVQDLDWDSITDTFEKTIEMMLYK
jgi:glycosyltransferase involved in cell wall biosynthesis